MTNFGSSIKISTACRDASTHPAVGRIGDFPSQSAVYAARKSFAGAWSGLLHDAFPSAMAVARAFSVDPATARDWWHGRGAPSGYAVAIAFRSMPALAARWLIESIGGWVSFVMPPQRCAA